AHPARRDARPDRRQGAARQRLPRARLCRAAARLAGHPRRLPRRADRRRLSPAAGDGGEPALRPALHQQAQHGAADRAGRLCPRPARARRVRRAGDLRPGAGGGGDDDPVGGVVPGALGAHRRRLGAGAVTPRVYRALFWLLAVAAAIFAFGLVQSILVPFAVGFFIAYALAPVVARLESWGVRRTLGSLAVLVLFLLGVAILLLLLVPLVQGQVVQLIAKVPRLVSALQDQIGRLMQLLQERLPAEEVAKLRDSLGGKLGEAVTWLAGLVQGMVTSSFAILNIISLVIVTPIVTFFFLRDWEIMVATIDSYLPRQSLDTLRGQALVCLILAAYYSVALTAAGIESSLALGVLIGVLAIIPILGVATGLLLSLGLAASQYGTWTPVFVVAGIFLFGQLVEANFLTPKLLGDRIHLHPVWVIFALFAGGTLFGFVGILLAVPAAAVIGVLIRFGLARYRRSSLYDQRQPPIVRGLTPHR